MLFENMNGVHGRPWGVKAVGKTRTLGTDTAVDHLSLDNASGEDIMRHDDGTNYYANADSAVTQNELGPLSGLGMHVPETIQDI